MKPVCVKCQRFYRVTRNGYYFMEGMPIGGQGFSTLAGTADPERWTPYKIWVGDLWECPDCLAQTVVGVGAHPIAEHFEDRFEDVRQRTGADRLLVKDC